MRLSDYFVPTLWFGSFSEMLQRGLRASLLILIVILIRKVFKKAPSWFRCALWLIVFAQLIIPFEIESPFSVYRYIPQNESVKSYYANTIGASNVALEEVRLSDKAGEAENQKVSSSDETGAAGMKAAWDTSRDGDNNWLKAFDINPLVLPAVWGVGALLLLMYLMFSFFRVKYQVRTAVPVKENIYKSDEVDTPFVFGLVFPHIYLSSSIKASNMDYVVAHEKTHIKRGDQWWKVLGYVAVCLHWMNPLVWLSYILFCRDLELACDERVIKDYDMEEKKAYSTALLECSMQRKAVFAGPIAFGEIGVKERVKNVLNFKKPAMWIIGAALAICVVVGVCFMTSPQSAEAETSNNIAGTYIYEREGFGGDFSIDLYEDGTFKYYEGPLSSYIAFGKWTLDGKIITITVPADGTDDSINRFEKKNDKLIWIADGSDNFGFVTVKDGDFFEYNEEMSANHEESGLTYDEDADSLDAEKAKHDAEEAKHHVEEAKHHVEEAKHDEEEAKHHEEEAKHHTEEAQHDAEEVNHETYYESNHKANAEIKDAISFSDDKRDSFFVSEEDNSTISIRYDKDSDCYITDVWLESEGIGYYFGNGSFNDKGIYEFEAFENNLLNVCELQSDGDLWDLVVVNSEKENISLPNILKKGFKQVDESVYLKYSNNNDM